MGSKTTRFIALAIFFVGPLGIIAAQSTNIPAATPAATNSLSAPASPDLPKTDTATSLAWSSDISSALKQAESEKKMIVVYLSPDWDVSGKKMEAQTFANPDVQAQLKKAVLVKIDPGQSDDATTLATRLKVSTFPTIVVLNYKGAVVANITGFQDAASLTDILSYYGQLFQNNPLGPAPIDLTPNDPLTQALDHKPDDSNFPPRTVFYFPYYSEETAAHKDGSSTRVFRACKYIAHPEFARNDSDVSGLSHRYSDSLQKQHLLYARIISPGGGCQSLDLSQMTDKPYLNAGDTTWDERVFVLPSRKLAQGEILDYAVMIENKPMIPGHFDLIMDTWNSHPIILHRDMILHFPSELRLSKTAVRTDDPVVETNEPDGTITWHIKSSSPPPGSDTLFLTNEAESWQGYRVNSPGTWEDVAAWYRTQVAGLDSLGQDAKDMVAGIKQQTSDPRELALDLCKWVKDNIRYYPIDLQQSSLQPHAADATYHYRCGDKKDMTLLLGALLHEAGIPSCPVLLASGYGNRLSVDQPNTCDIDHCLIAAQIGGSDIYLDPTADLGGEGHLPLSDSNTQGLKIEASKSEIVTLPPYQAGEGRKPIIEEIILHADGSAAITAHFQFVGNDADQLKMLCSRVPVNRLKDIFAQFLKMAKETLTDISFPNPNTTDGTLEINCVISSPQFAKDSGRGLMINLGDKSQCRPYVIGLEQPRTGPLRFYPSDPLINRYIITLPPGTKLLSKPNDLRLDTSYFTATQVSSLDGNKLSLVNTYVTKDAVIPSNQKDAVLDAFQQVENSLPATFIVAPPAPPVQQQSQVQQAADQNLQPTPDPTPPPASRPVD